MQYQRVYKLPNLNGGVDIITDTGELITQDRFDDVKNNAGRTGFAYQPAEATPEQIENRYLELLMDEYPDKLDTVETQAKDLTNKYLGITPEPVQKASPKKGNTLAERRQALKQESKGQRMAGDVFTKVIDNELVPWDQRTRGKDGNQIWIGKNAQQFRRAANELKDEIYNASSNTEMIRKLVEQYDYTPGAAEKAVNEVKAGKPFPTLKLGEPNFTADERIAAAIMEGSGIEDVRDWNRMDPVTATDLMAKIGPGPLKGVDAQRRFRPELAIGVLQGLSRDQRRAIVDAKQNGNLKLGQLLSMINTEGTLEDKLLHTQAYMQGKPSERMRDDDQFANYRKDFLVSADMNSYVQNSMDRQIFDRAKGPYNPQVGDDYAMINLNNMREELFDTKIRELLGKGYELVADRSGKLQLVVPRLELPRFTSNDLLDQSIIAEAKARGLRRR